jgi:hypothetical protein
MAGFEVTTEGQTQETKKVVIVTGRLLRKDKTPLADTPVWVHAASEKGGFAVRVGEGGVMLDPHQNTQKTGRFEIEIKSKQYPKFTLVIDYASRRRELRGPDDAPVFFEALGNAKVNVGDIVVSSDAISQGRED